MPPTRRARSPAATPPPPYAIKGWLSRCRGSTRSRNGWRGAAGADDDPLAILPDDLLYGSILSRVFSDAADIARCAAACRRWGRIVAARGATTICRSLPPPDRLLPHLALGFFHGGTDDGNTRRRRLAASSQPSPWFVPMASATRLIGSPFPGLLLGGSLFHHARPVASRNGLVVLELWSVGARRAEDLALAVCNPMTGNVALLQPLAGPGHDYACALLTADDLLDEHGPPGPRRPGLFFSLVLVYNRRGFTALRFYTTSSSSDGDGSWGPEARKPGAKIKGHTLRHLGQAVVLAGVAYWPMYLGALGVRLDGAGAGVVDVCMVPYWGTNAPPGNRLLGTVPDGRLSFISVGVLKDIFSFEVDTLDLRSIDDMSTAADRWERHKLIDLHQLKVSRTTHIKLRWLCEKSGTLFFTVVGEGASTSGAFALNLATMSFEKLADGAECNSWTSFCGYEMDHTALIASITARFT
ncbi:unnamed protein product [Miscanthus lutarioriparius]|uniref:DUF7595 domain-containing protein n=1 Tax=Miscanthus lutarioriparius TaxID=422564 RepID=A0A811S9H1_9POAL|nr:unnamed protein product [Miscanthus lutarioriparius]